jgi:hypothetical protein
MKLGKPYQLYRTSSNNCMLSEKLAEADSKEELWQLHNRRPDYQYAILQSGERIKVEWLS